MDDKQFNLLLNSLQDIKIDIAEVKKEVIEVKKEVKEIKEDLTEFKKETNTRLTLLENGQKNLENKVDTEFNQLAGILQEFKKDIRDNEFETSINRTMVKDVAYRVKDIEIKLGGRM